MCSAVFCLRPFRQKFRTNDVAIKRFPIGCYQRAKIQSWSATNQRTADGSLLETQSVWTFSTRISDVPLVGGVKPARKRDATRAVKEMLQYFKGFFFLVYKIIKIK